jgi:hypothetical protein
MKISTLLLGILIALVTVIGANAAGVDLGACYQSDYTTVVVDFGDGYGAVNATAQLTISSNCTEGNTVEFLAPVNLEYFGNVTTGQVVIGPNSIFVDSVSRPDLDVPSKLTFKGVTFVEEPTVLRNGGTCFNCSNGSFDPALRTYTVVVPGFSNYSLEGKKDFVVRSDPQPELDKKVYQVIDLGNSNRGIEYKCTVQVYALNEVNQWVLVETNPTRAVQARILGNPDPNQPESLGYFKTENGIANVYFDGASVMITGYHDYEYVAQCASNSTKLVYEEPISTRYHPVGRNAPGRGIWFVENGFYIVIYFVAGIIIVWIVLLILKGLQNNWRYKGRR